VEVGVALKLKELALILKTSSQLTTTKEKKRRWAGAQKAMEERRERQCKYIYKNDKNTQLF
jgi:hypothetical protein